MDINIEDLQVFVSVAEHRSMTRAAAALNLSKQSVSARVARLESSLRVRLLERSTRHLRLTDAGATYYAHCRDIAERVTEANDAVRQLQSEPRGTLRVASPTLFAHTVLTNSVIRFRRMYPETQVEVTLVDRRVDPIADGVDLAVQVGRLPDSGHLARRLGAVSLMIVASPEFIQSHGTPDIRQLGDVPILSRFDREEWRIGTQRIHVTASLRATDLEVLCRFAMAGLGVARLPSLLCQTAVDDGRLVQLFADIPPSLREVWAVYPSRRFLPVRVQRFLEVLLEDSAALRRELSSERVRTSR